MNTDLSNLARTLASSIAVYILVGCAVTPALPLDVPPSIEGSYKLAPQNNSGDPWLANWLNHSSIKPKKITPIVEPIFWFPINSQPTVDGEGLFVANEKLWKPVRGKYQGDTDFENVINWNERLTQNKMARAGYQKAYILEHRFLGVKLNNRRLKITDASELFSEKWSAARIPGDVKRSTPFTYVIGKDGKLDLTNCRVTQIVCDLIGSIGVNDVLPNSDDKPIRGRGEFQTKTSYTYYPLMKSLRDSGPYSDYEMYQSMATSVLAYKDLEDLNRTNVLAQHEEEKAQALRVKLLDDQLQQQKRADEALAAERMAEQVRHVTAQRAARKQQEETARAARAARVAYEKTPEGQAEVAAEQERKRIEREERKAYKLANWPAEAVGKIRGGAWLCPDLRSARLSITMERAGHISGNKRDCNTVPWNGLFLSKIQSQQSGITQVFVSDYGRSYYTNNSKIERK